MSAATVRGRHHQTKAGHHMITDTTHEPETDEAGPFLLFTGDRYYPIGGAHDLRAVFATMGEALTAGLDGQPWDWSQPDWAHIAVVREGKLAILWERDRDRT